MRDKRLKTLILALANCIVYSCFSIQLRDNTIFGVFWMFSQYISAFIALVSISPLLEMNKKKKINIVKWALMVFGILGIVICAFVSSSDLQRDIKTYSLLCELVLVVFILVMYYTLSHDTLQNINRNIDLIRNLEKRESLNENKNIDGEQVLNFLHRKDIPSNKKRQVKAALWVMICTIIILFDCLVLPLILKCMECQINVIISSYCICLSVLLGSILYKNNLYYVKWIQVIVVTCFDFLGIAIGCISDAYLNICVGQLNGNSYSVYFGPYLIIGIGMIPFLVSAYKITNNYKKIFTNIEE